MLHKIISSQWSYGYILSVAILSSLLGIVFPGQWGLPLLNTLGIYPLFFYNLKNRNYRQALHQMLLWAVVMSITIILVSYFFNAQMESKILRGEQYRNEMFTWLKTGVGEESSPSQFIPKHILHFILFALLTLLTGGFASLFFGSVLLNYMNYYVGSLFAHTTNPLLLIIFAWQPWAISRVIGYIAIAIGLSEISFSYILKRPFKKEVIKNYFLGGLFCVILDLFLKTLLAPTWQKVIQSIVQW
ncbi:MAG: hypothetical protein QME64_05200 [bacterium]|nr:hypothetical protein [bacterium]